MSAETTAPDLNELETLSGYRETDEYLAIQFRQGGRDIYCLDLSVERLVSMLPQLDALRSHTSSHSHDPKPARDFATAITNSPSWSTSPLLLRAPATTLAFEPLKRLGGTAWGILTLPRRAQTDLAVVEGSHRLLGFHLAFDALTEELDAARGKRADEPAIQTIREKRTHLAKECVAVQIAVLEPDEDYRPLVDKSDETRGFAQTLLARFSHPKGMLSPMQMGQTSQALAEAKRDVERERDALAKERDTLQKQLAESEKAQQGLHDQLDDVRSQFTAMVRSVRLAGDEDSKMEPAPVTSVAEAVERARDLPGLRFLDSASKTAKDSPYEKPAEVFGAFVALSNLAAIHDHIGMKVEDWLANAGIEYAGHLGHQGSPTASLRNKKYMFDVDGEAVLMKEHLKFGVSREPRHCCRVYMKWRKDEWVIGHVGKHL